MSKDRPSEWTAVYETRSPSDAELVRTTLEVAGYRVSIDSPEPGPLGMRAVDGPSALTVSVPAEDADDARDFLREKTSLVTNAPTEPAAEDAQGQTAPAQTETVEDAAKEVLELRSQHQVAACKYCGIPTFDLSEIDLESHAIALLRAAGLGVNSATFSDFEAGERICSECAGHEVTCDLCGRTLDAFLDGGQYRRANDDEAYVCAPCMGQLEARLDAGRDW